MDCKAHKASALGSYTGALFQGASLFFAGSRGAAGEEFMDYDHRRISAQIP
jgi:hypothetical protein